MQPTPSTPPTHSSMPSMPSVLSVPSDTASLVLLDRAAALKRMGGSQGLLDELTASFVTDLWTQRPAWLAELAQKARVEARRRMHSLKGTAATVGAVKLAAVAQQLEAALGEGADLEAIAQGALSQQLQSVVD